MIIQTNIKLVQCWRELEKDVKIRKRRSLGAILKASNRGVVPFPKLTDNY